MCFGGGGGKEADRYAQEQRAAEQARQARIKTGVAELDRQFAGFDDAFYNKQRDAYMRFAMPQVNQQYDDAFRGLTYALSRQGIKQSSEGARRFGNLSGDFDVARQGVVNQADQAVKGARRDIEGARSNLVADLYATGDPQAAASSAARQAIYLAQPLPVSPIGQLFTTALQGLGQYQQGYNDQQAYNQAQSSYGYNSGRNVR